MKKVNQTTLIDWDKPQWVVSGDCVILTTGGHKDCCFKGTCLPCKRFPNGIFSVGWTKAEFTPVTGDIPFIISNEE